MRPNDLNIHQKAYTLWKFKPVFDFSVVVKDLAICDQGLLSFICHRYLSTFAFSLQDMHTLIMTGCGSAKMPQTNIQPQCPIMLVLLLFLPVSFILTTASGTCLDLTLLKLAYSISDYKSTYQNGTYKKHQQAQSKRGLRPLWKCDGSQEKDVVPECT